MAENVLIGGSLAQKPGFGGHAWVFLQYLLGFRRLGFDVLFLDQLRPGMCVDDDGNECDFEHSHNLRYFLDVMRRFGLEGSFSLDYNYGEVVVGVPRDKVKDRARSSVLFNVMGYLKDADVLDVVPRRVFVDIDPGHGQMWQALGLAEMFAGHDEFVTIGQNIGLPECAIPTCGLAWVTTPPPIVLDSWLPTLMPPVRGLSSIASWRGAYGPMEFGGQSYGQRVHEFRKMIELPCKCGQTIELALDIHPSDGNDRDRLLENGWRLVDPRVVAGDPNSYQEYIQSSQAEFMVAQGMYVKSKSGWFSDRSVCYLASGRPVIAQDTGLKKHYPTGLGLMLFSTLDEAMAAIDDVLSHYTRHAVAAREIAEDVFDSDKVLARLLSRLGVK
jgi:hypothetical protein